MSIQTFKTIYLMEIDENGIEETQEELIPSTYREALESDNNRTPTSSNLLGENSIRENYSALTRKYSELENRCVELQKIQEQSLEETQELENVKIHLLEMGKERDALRVTLRSLEEEKRKVQEELAEVQSQLKDLRLQLKQTLESKEELKQEHRNLAVETSRMQEALKEQLEATQKELEELRLTSATTELAPELAAEVEEYKVCNQNLSDQIIKMEKELVEKMTETQSLQKQLESLSQEFIDFRKSNQKSSEEERAGELEQLQAKLLEEQREKERYREGRNQAIELGRKIEEERNQLLGQLQELRQNYTPSQETLTLQQHLEEARALATRYREERNNAIILGKQYEEEVLRFRSSTAPLPEDTSASTVSLEDL